MAGWLANCSWLAGWLAIKQNINPILPRQRHLVAKCVTTAVRLTCGQMYPQAESSCGQVIVLHLWVRLTFDQMYPHGQRHLVAKCDTTSPLGQVDIWSAVPPWAETSCGQVWYYFTSGWPVYWRVTLVPAATVIPAPLACIKVVAVKMLVLSLFRWLNLSHFWAHISLCKKPKTEKVVWTWKDDWSPGRLIHERPFTWEGNYIVWAKCSVSSLHLSHICHLLAFNCSFTR